MKIVFMGTPDFAVATLQALVTAGHEVCLVMTQPDRPRGRHGELQKSDVRMAAEKFGIPVRTPLRLRKDEAAIAELRALQPDAIVVTAFGQILPKEVLEIPRLGCINVHASLLPKYRGAAPIQWAVLNGDAESGVTTMMMNEGLDTGDILMTEKLTLDPKETGGSLFDRLAVLGGELIVRTLAALEAGNCPRVPQEEAEASKVSVFTKTFGLISWAETAAVLERRVRGLNPWPSAYTYLSGKQLKLWDTAVCETLPAGSRLLGRADFEKSLSVLEKAGDERAKTFSWKDAEGSFYTTADGTGLYVQTGEGCLQILELQLEGKKRMKAPDFLRGYKW